MARLYTHEKPLFQMSHTRVPKLELTKEPSQERGRWKGAKKTQGLSKKVSKKGEGLQLPLGLAGL